MKLWKHKYLYTEVQYYAYHDKIAGSVGKTSFRYCKSHLARLFFKLFSTRFYSASIIYNTCFTPISKNRLSRYNPNAKGLFGFTQNAKSQKNPALLHSLLCRKKAGKKRAFENLLNAIFQQATDIGLLQQQPLAAIDSTGLESRHTSRYYVYRKGYKRFVRYEWPKITTVCDTCTHLFAACIVTRGPSNDSPQFAPAVIQASQFVQFAQLLADAAYDGEHNHELCHEELGMTGTMIPLNKRRSHKWPKSKYRRQMKTQFDKELYNQRWQIESAFSRNKRLLGSALRSRTEQARERECFLRILTHNLMILRRAA
jgi:transposase